MASSATTKAARKAAREATIAAQEEIARRTRANMDDLTVFFSARQRADAVDEWLKERVQALREQADQRRADQLRQGGVALRAMKQRGESVRDIARMAGIGEKTVRELIRSADTALEPAGPDAVNGAVGGEAVSANGQYSTDQAGSAAGGGHDGAPTPPGT